MFLIENSVCYHMTYFVRNLKLLLNSSGIKFSNLEKSYNYIVLTNFNCNFPNNYKVSRLLQKAAVLVAMHASHNVQIFHHLMQASHDRNLFLLNTASHLHKPIAFTHIKIQTSTKYEHK